jgi:signal transduction histidine kinase
MAVANTNVPRHPLTQGHQPASLHLRAWAWSITFIYALVATLWIYFSDQALMAVVPDAETFARWSVNKGIGFVAVTSALLLVLIGRAFRALEKAYGELHALNDSLEAKVASRTAQLEAAVVRAEAADRLKSAFLATMSHELRTPLNSIIGFTGIVLQEMAGPLTPEQHKQLGMVRNSARHLLDLINDVLDLSKIEAGQLQVKAEAFDVGETISRALASLTPLAEKKGLALHADIDPRLGTMHSDRRRVEQIVLNLLNNGIKFTDRGSVTVSADIDPGFRAAEGAAPVAALRLRVRDTGIGIAAEDLQGLFQPFSQVDSGLTRQHEGTGLGLAICRRLATLLGGTISAQSQCAEGSEFTVVLPLELT